MLDVIYEDNHIIAVNKPAGVPVQKGRNGESLDLMVKDYLRSKYKKTGNVFLGIVHRLDQPVSGIVIFGKTSKGASRLSEQFRERTVKKIYRAILVGKFKEKKDVLKTKIKKQGKGYFRARTGEKGKDAELEYKVVKEGEINSLAEIRIKTGRFHQIRVQMGSVGHPVAGDLKYGSPIKLPDGRIALNSAKMEFNSATGDKKIKLSIPDPAYFEDLL